MNCMPRTMRKLVTSQVSSFRSAFFRHSLKLMAWADPSGFSPYLSVCLSVWTGRKVESCASGVSFAGVHVK